MRRSWLISGAVLASIVFALALTLTSCQQKPSAPPPPETATQPPETTPKPPAPQPPETPPSIEQPPQGPQTSPATVPPTPRPEVKNPDTYVVVAIGDFIDTLDPAAAYDTGSGSIIFNIYETLIFFDGPHPDKFVPWLATAVPSLENGLIRDGGRTYVFPIRQGVKFHYGPVKDANGNEIPGSGILTPEDVEYSFERGMLQDRAGGPQWLLLEPLLGVSSILDLARQVEHELHGTDPALFGL
jgi:ABC-type transport system substrate-binding protein